MVGLDILVHASNTVYERATKDEKRDVFKTPDPIQKMLAKGLLGDKTGKGFYQKVAGKEGGSEILTLDLATLEYRERQSPKFPSLEAAKSVEALGERIRAVTNINDRAGAFVWRIVADVLLYSATRMGEIADDIASIDKAMRWGFGWEMGPFELWDAIGLEKSIERMEMERRTLPPIVIETYKSPTKKFYRKEEPTKRPRLSRGTLKPVEEASTTIDLAALKAAGKVVKKNAGASLVDIGDGALVSRIPFQDERHRRRHHLDGNGGGQRDRDELRSACYWQPWRELFRRRQRDAALARGARRQLG